MSKRSNEELFADAVIPYLSSDLERECRTAAERGNSSAEIEHTCHTFTLTKDFPDWKEKYFEPRKFWRRGGEHLNATSSFYSAAERRLIGMIKHTGLTLVALEITHFCSRIARAADEIVIKYKVSW